MAVAGVAPAEKIWSGAAEEKCQQNLRGVNMEWCCLRVYWQKQSCGAQQLGPSGDKAG